jgi:hypothetical protein
MARGRHVAVVLCALLCSSGMNIAQAKLSPRYRHGSLYNEGMAFSGASTFAFSKGPAALQPAKDWAPGVCTGEAPATLIRNRAS